MQRVLARDLDLSSGGVRNVHRKYEVLENPDWWWEHYADISYPLEKVLAAGVDALEKEQSKRFRRSV